MKLNIMVAAGKEVPLDSMLSPAFLTKQSDMAVGNRTKTTMMRRNCCVVRVFMSNPHSSPSVVNSINPLGAALEMEVTG